MKALQSICMVTASRLLHSSPWCSLLHHSRGAGGCGGELRRLTSRHYRSSSSPASGTTTTQPATKTTTSMLNATPVDPTTSTDDACVANNTGSEPSTLLVGSQQDTASRAMISALLARGDWLETTPGVEPNGGQKGQAWVHAHARAFLWSVDSSLLDLDDADHRWAAEKSLGDWETEPPSQGTALLGGRRERPRSLPTDVVFLSKHLAKSGVPALCVHPIGLPDPSSSRAAGGRLGRCPPPSPRLAGCFRELERATREAGLDSTFDVTLEVTHHGPWLETPAMFVEIGSSEEHWGRADAANIWATVLTRVLGLDDSSPAIENWANLDQAARADRAAYVGLGGGHYAPRYSDLARLDGRYIGHMLASYCLDFGEEGRWQEAVTEAVQSTRAAFPGAGGGVTGGVAALVDKKSFRSADRSALLEHLTALGVEHKFKNSDC